jgi:hypothetical protein
MIKTKNNQDLLSHDMQVCSKKTKIETQFDKQILLTARNMELRDKVADLESQVTKQSGKVITGSDQVQKTSCVSPIDFVYSTK